MIVSFDLDDTLFVSPDRAKTEKELVFPLNKIYKERMRQGTRDLFQQLHARNIDTWIYTTSFRTEKYIRRLFKHYGIKITNVVNGEKHLKEVQGIKKDPMPSKYPSRYRIDLHIDDDISVAQNGKLYGFKVLIIKEEDDEWASSILATVDGMLQRTKQGKSE